MNVVRDEIERPPAYFSDVKMLFSRLLEGGGGGGGVEREMKELFEALLVTMTMLLQSRADTGDNYPDN